MSGALEQPLSLVNTDDPVLSWPSTPHLPLPFSQVPEQLPSLGKDTVESKLFLREKDGGRAESEQKKTEKRDLNVFEQSPGLISDTNRATGELCRAEEGRVRGRGGREADGQTRKRRERQTIHRTVEEEFGGQMFVCVN